MTFKRVLALLEGWAEDHPAPQPYRAAMRGLLVGVTACIDVPDGTVR
jgi:hypothetical protein